MKILNEEEFQNLCKGSGTYDMEKFRQDLMAKLPKPGTYRIGISADEFYNNYYSGDKKPVHYLHSARSRILGLKEVTWATTNKAKDMIVFRVEISKKKKSE